MTNSMKWVVAGVGRSGTTAIYHLLQRQAELLKCDFEYGYEPYLWGGDTWSADRVKFGKAFQTTDSINSQGLIAHLGTPLFDYSDSSNLSTEIRKDFFNNLFSADFSLTKFIRANGRLSQMAEQHEDLKFIIVCRNPLDVVNSFINKFSPFGTEFHKSDYERFVEEAKTQYSPPKTQLSEASKIGYWASVFTREALSFSQKYSERAVLVPYEVFLSQKGGFAKKIFSFLGQEAYRDLDSTLEIPSGPVSSGAVLRADDLKELRPAFNDYFQRLEAMGVDSGNVSWRTVKSRVLKRYKNLDEGSFSDERPKDISSLRLRGIVTGLETNISAVSSRAKELQSELLEQQTSSDGFVKKIEKLKSTQSKLLGQVTRFSNNKQILKKENLDIQDINKQLQGQIQCLQDDKAQLKNDKAQLKAENKQIQNEKKQLQSDKEQHQGEMQRLQNQMQELQKDLQRRKRSFRAALRLYDEAAGGCVDQGKSAKYLSERVAESLETVMNNRLIATSSIMSKKLTKNVHEVETRVSLLSQVAKVSVVITSYNNMDYIEAAIQSVLRQTMGADEILIADDCSTDGSRQFLEQKYGDSEKFTLILRDKNVGAAANRNDAIARARNAFFTTLDGDDKFGADKLRSDWKALKRNPDSIAFGDFALLFPGHSLQVVDCSSSVSKGVLDTLSVANRLVPLPHNMMYSKDVFFQSGGYDESARMYEDWSLKLRLSALDVKWVYTGAVGLIYLQHKGGVSKLSRPHHSFWRCYSIAQNYNLLLHSLGRDNLKENLYKNIFGSDELISKEEFDDLVKRNSKDIQFKGILRSQDINLANLHHSKLIPVLNRLSQVIE